jgi:hypothetical protein
MPKPVDVPGVMRFLGMIKYLAKFLPNLTEKTKPLRQLTLNDREWRWDSQHEDSFQTLKNAITKTPVLIYYDVKKEVTIQCDASQSGVGGVLLQEGKPVAFTSRSMTKTEERYAQIEKEMFAIVHCCTKFDQYIYGRSVIHVETDHKPLETIFRKRISSSPKRLQRMLMFLQKYTLEVNYKRGKDLYIADTLSRAYLQTEEKIDRKMDVLSVDEKLYNFIADMNPLHHVPNSQKRMEEIREATRKDEVMQEVIKYVRDGWPEERRQVAAEVKSSFDITEELTEETGLLLKGVRVVIPRSQRPKTA